MARQNSNSLSHTIKAIGQGVLTCPLNCDGILNEPSQDILPRGLHLENPDASGPGVIFCGENPGPSSPNERQFYSNRGRSYDGLLDYWNNFSRGEPYYEKARHFVKALGYTDGPILFTNVAKCEKEKPLKIDFSKQPQIFRTCAHRFLVREIQACPDSWLLIANGGYAFNFLAPLFPDHSLIGIPHTTGRGGPHFDNLWFNRGGLKPSVQQATNNFFRKPQLNALWLTASD